MSHLNGVLADAGLNVTQLHLETDRGLGVAVVDLSRAPDAATLAAVRGIEATLGAFLALANAP
jgi:D-3-phosphoglycerate dehydrogenase